MAQTYANGDTSNPMVLAQYKEIIDTIDYEKNVGETLSVMQMVKTPVARKRMTLAISAAVFSTISGTPPSFRLLPNVQADEREQET